MINPTFRVRYTNNSGVLASIANNPELEEIVSFGSISTSQSLPTFSNIPKLRTFVCIGSGLSGSISSLNSNVVLRTFNLISRSVVGSIPNLSNNVQLETFSVPNCALSGFTGGVPITLGSFLATSNQLPASAINSILAAFVAAGRTISNGRCYLSLGGTGNAAPTGQGLTDKATLQSRGWTVSTN